MGIHGLNGGPSEHNGGSNGGSSVPWLTKPKEHVLLGPPFGVRALDSNFVFDSSLCFGLPRVPDVPALDFSNTTRDFIMVS